MTVATNVRPGRVFRTLIAAQSAKGVPVSDFTNAAQIWAREGKMDVVNDQIEPGWWMNYHNADFEGARYSVNVLRESAVSGLATPTLLSILLQSAFGSLSGSTFTATGYVNKWLSFGFVEDKTLANTSLRFGRCSDALIYEI
jgi:hypothetical protein